MDYAVAFVSVATVVALLALASLVVASPKIDSVEVMAPVVNHQAVVDAETDTDDSPETATTEQDSEETSVPLDSESVGLVPTDDEPSLVSEISEPKALEKGKARWGLSFRSKKVSNKSPDIAEQKPETPVKKSFRWNRSKGKVV